MRVSRIRCARLARLLLLAPVLLAAGCGGSFAARPGPTPGATAGARPTGLTVVAPLTLDRTAVARGETIIGGVTYANETGTPLAVRTFLIAVRPPVGTLPALEDLHFAPPSGALTLSPGERYTLVATHTPATDAVAGTWTAFSSYQDEAGRWHPAPAAATVAFGVDIPPARATPGATANGGVLAPRSVASLTSPTPLYWGAYIDGVPWDRAKLAAFEARAGKGASVVHWGQAWWHDGTYQPFYAGDFERVRAHGAIPLIDWASWDYALGPDQPAFSLASIIRGDHDAYIRRWAAGARDWGHPFFLRFDWEMNGWWRFPWSERLNGNRPGEYVRAWRHVHDLFAEVGATNVTWVWCPNVIVPETAPLAGLYPGDEYVDWVAMDGHNWGAEYGNAWRPFAAIFAPTYAALRQLAPEKPIMIAEVASVERGGDKAAWIRDALGVQLPARFPAIKAVVWFNWDDDDPLLTWPIESTASSSAAFGEAVGGSSAYLPNRFGDLPAGPIQPFAIE